MSKTIKKTYELELLHLHRRCGALTRAETGRCDRAPLGAGEDRRNALHYLARTARSGERMRLRPPEGSLSPTSRQAPENIKATKEILQIQNLLWDFQGFHGF